MPALGRVGVSRKIEDDDDEQLGEAWPGLLAARRRRRPPGPPGPGIPFVKKDEAVGEGRKRERCHDK